MSKQLTAQAPVDPIVLGKMGSSYGIRGWLRVFSSTEDAESIFDYQPRVYPEGGSVAASPAGKLEAPQSGHDHQAERR